MPKVVDPELRRHEVARALFRVVVREGLDAASLRKVAAEAGLVIGSVRHYFHTHEQLMLFAQQELINAVSARVATHVEHIRNAQASGDRRARAERMLAELLPLDEQRHEEAVVWLAFSTAARTNDTLRPYAHQLSSSHRALITRMLHEANQAGRLVAGLDLDIETERLAALLDGLTLDAVTTPQRMTPPRMREILHRHLGALVAT